MNRDDLDVMAEELRKLGYTVTPPEPKPLSVTPPKTKPLSEPATADRLRALVMRRVNARHSREVQCPRERSEMTPCVARDGAYAVADDGVCVGCGQRPSKLLADEQSKQE